MQRSKFNEKLDDFLSEWMEREPISLAIIPPLIACSLLALVLFGIVHLLPILF